jgi:hypothetical protein
LRRPFAAAALWLAAVVVACGGRPVAGADLAHLAELAAEADRRGLAQTPEWRALVHYAPDLLGPGRTALVDHPGFYLAADGQTDPRAELRATMEAFFAPVPAAGPDGHGQCRKPARYRWLKEVLAFDPARLPEIPCPAFDAWIGDIDPGQLTLVFPAAYLDNPSSMFGHTLIRIDPSRRPADARLASYTIHFAADHRGEGGVIFGVKGLAGGYRGYFSLLPYYEKVTQYSNIENRDIWEYELDFAPHEIRRLLENLWEIDRQPVDYYFFTTNCSYVLLSLIDAARPTLELKRRFPLHAVPVDTVRALTEEPGLLRRAVFRPSARTRIRRLQERLPADRQRLALALADGTVEADAPAVAALPDEERARVLELAQSTLQYRRDTGDLPRAAMAPRALALLQARARIPLPAVAGDDDAPPPPRPDLGHFSARVAGGIGMTGDRPFAEVRLRAVYHDPLDPAAGFVDGAAIEIGAVRLRQYAADPPLVEEVTAVAIRSLSPRDEIFRPISWNTRVGLKRLREDGGDAGEPVFEIAGGAGPAWDLGADALVSPQVAGALYGGERWPRDRIAGLGPAIDLWWPPAPWWTVHLRADQQSAWGSERTSLAFGATVGQGFRLARNLSWRIEAGIRNDGDESFGEWSTSLHWYF